MHLASMSDMKRKNQKTVFQKNANGHIIFFKINCDRQAIILWLPKMLDVCWVWVLNSLPYDKPENVSLFNQQICLDYIFNKKVKCFFFFVHLPFHHHFKCTRATIYSQHWAKYFGELGGNFKFHKEREAHMSRKIEWWIIKFLPVDSF